MDEKEINEGSKEIIINKKKETNKHVMEIIVKGWTRN